MISSPRNAAGEKGPYAARRPVRANWYYGWNVAAVAILFQIVVSGTAITSFSLWVSSWTQAFHSERAPVISAMTLTLIVSGILSPTVGNLLDKRSIRLMICVGLLCFAAAFALLAVSNALWQVIACYGVLLGISTTLCGSLAAQTLMTKWFAARAGLAIGIALTGLSLGGVVMPPVLAFLLTTFGWRIAAAIIAGIGLALLPVVLLVVRNSPQEMGMVAEIGPATSPIVPTGGPPLHRVTDILLHPNFWPLVLTFVPLFAVMKGLGANFGPIAADAGISPSTAANLLVVNNLCCVVGKVVIGRIADRADSRLILLVFILITGLGFVTLMDHPNSGRMLVGSVLLGFGVACLYPMQGITIRRYFGIASFGRVLGILNLFFLLSACGGQLAALVRDRFGSYDTFLAVAAVAPLLLSLTILRLRTPREIP
jgi:MFS family permease